MCSDSALQGFAVPVQFSDLSFQTGARMHCNAHLATNFYPNSLGKGQETDIDDGAGMNDDATGYNCFDMFAFHAKGSEIE